MTTQTIRQPMEERELELALREAELNRRESALRRAEEARADEEEGSSARASSALEAELEAKIAAAEARERELERTIGAVEAPDVVLDLGVVLCGEAVPELGTFLAQALDLRVDS